MKALNNFALLFLLLFGNCGTSSFGNKELDKEQYLSALKQVDSNVIEKVVGNITYKLIYKPAEYMMLSENKNMDHLDENGLMLEYKKFEYYTLEIMIKDFTDEILKYKTESPEQYANKVDYYSFKFQNDIFKITGKDTTICASYHFERNYGISPKIRFNLAFASSDDDNRTIYINEKYLGTGPVKFAFNKKDIENLPTLKLTN